MGKNVYLRIVLGRPLRGAKHNRLKVRNGNPTMRVGDRVRLVTPENPRLDGAIATINQLMEWGAFCLTPAAATGQVRALWGEMELVGEVYTGQCCAVCGGVRMRQSGTCSVCEDCGESGGCG